MTSALVTIARFPGAAPAHAAQAALEAAGLPAFLESAELAAMAWHLAGAVDVKLQVSPDDVGAAEQVLSGLELLPSARKCGQPLAMPAVARCADCRLALNDGDTGCPACGWSANAAHASAARTEDDDGTLGRVGPLSNIRRNWRWLIWLWTLPAVLAITFGVAAMLASIVRDVFRPVVRIDPSIVQLMLWIITVVCLIAAVIFRKRRPSL